MSQFSKRGRSDNRWAVPYPEAKAKILQLAEGKLAKHMTPDRTEQWFARTRMFGPSMMTTDLQDPPKMSLTGLVELDRLKDCEQLKHLFEEMIIIGERIKSGEIELDHPQIYVNLSKVPYTFLKRLQRIIYKQKIVNWHLSFEQLCARKHDMDTAEWEELACNLLYYGEPEPLYELEQKALDAFELVIDHCDLSRRGRTMRNILYVPLHYGLY